MKAFFSKISTWILAHKIIAIVVASVLVVGTTCAIVLPIALHEHSYATEWSSDAENHWHGATCKHEEEKSDLDAHTYTNACDTTCDVCEYTRTADAHVYDNACDTTCNVCSAERTVESHVYDNTCDTTCNVCSAERTIESHVYDNACDTACNVCGVTRTITHDYAETLTAGETTHYYACSVCGDKKDEAAHVFDKTVASSEYLKAAATATTKAQYYKSCVCGKASATEYFESDKTAGTLANVQDLSKTYDKAELANPTYETNSDGAVTVEWYQGDTKLNAKPVNAGTYKVKVIIAESATYTGISAEKEFTIAQKTLNYLELTKVYDGEGILAYALGTEHGVVAGDEVLFYCDEGPDYIVGTYGLIPENDPTTIDEDGADDRALLAGADKENYKFAERIEGKYKLCATVTVTPKTLNYLELTKVYDGAGFIDYPLGTEHGVVPGEDVVLTCDEEFDYDAGSYYFVDKTDDISLTDAGIDRALLSGADAGNYQFANQKVSGLDKYEMGGMLTVTKCPVWAENVEFTYDGYTYWTGEESPKQIVFQNMANGETMDSSFVKWTFNSNDVHATLTSVTFEDEDDGRSNYEIDFSKCSASIIPREIWVTGAQFYYDGYTTTMDDVAINGITIHNAATEEDESYMGGFFVFCFEDSDVGSNLENVTLDLEDFSDNYTINVSKCEAEIVPMELTKLKVQITESTFEEGWAYLNATNGVVHGDKVYLVWTESGHSNTMQWKEHGSDLVAPHTGTAVQGQAQVTLDGVDAHNYKLVINNNTYGRMEYSEKCKPDVYGYCACGEDHIVYTFNSADTVATVPVGPAGGTTWEGGIYALNTTTPGYWSIKPNDNYCTVTVYSPYGYKVTMKGFEFYAATAGTYYVHISKNSEPAVGDVITFRFAYELKNNGGSYVSQNVNCQGGSYYYFKIDANAKWGASLHVMDGNGAIMDSSKYTVKIYDQNFIEMTDVIYDGTDIFKESDDDFTVTDKLIYIQITVNVDTELCISAF